MHSRSIVKFFFLFFFFLFNVYMQLVADLSVDGKSDIGTEFPVRLRAPCPGSQLDAIFKP